jgi:hypothetical protein
MSPPSSPREQTGALPHDSPPRTKHVHNDPFYQNGSLEQARAAVLLDLGSHIPMVTLEDFLEYLAPPRPDFDLDATIQSLKLGPDPALSRSNRWSKFSKASKRSKRPKEDTLFGPMPDIFTKVVAAIAANSRGNLSEENRTIDFLQNPSLAPTSAERVNENRPDGYFVLKHRNKVWSKDGKEIIHWADIALSCEYKRNDSDADLDDVRIH